MKNRLICGDNLKALKTVEDESVDLIYIDPPFFSNRRYEVVWGDEAEVRSFEDRWEGGINAYVEWMRPRVEELYRVLEPTGSFYLHCDWHASHYLKVMLDETFGERNFRNEIIWKRATMSGAKAVGKQMGRNHDIAFLYSRGNEWTYNTQYIPYTDDYIGKKFVYRDPDGRRYRLQPKGTRSEKAIEEFRRQGRIVQSKTGYIQIKFYLDEMPGVALDDVWTDIKDIRTVQSREKLGYPTQKPEALLERIIRANSNKGDMVLDAFCGCGTTLVVAHKLKRNWIGIDISPTAMKVMEDRLRKVGAIKDVHYATIGMPTTVKELKELKPFEFQNWVIKAMEAKQSRKKVGNKGLDGYFVKDLWHDKGGIQVKQSDRVGRNVVDNFETALKRGKYNKGYIVAFSFTKDAYEEVARLRNRRELDIKLIKVEELLYKKKPVLGEKGLNNG